MAHPWIYDPPTPLQIALEQVAAWLEAPNLVVLSEHGGYWDQLREIAVRARLSGAMIHDARVAALCLFHGVETLWSADRDFSRFPGLRVVNPLLARQQ